KKALLIDSEEKPDLVLLDWMMPQLSGIEVCRRLRSRQETRNVPIIMITARGEETHPMPRLGPRPRGSVDKAVRRGRADGPRARRDAPHPPEPGARHDRDRRHR